MHRLVALDLPGGPRFVDALRRCWDEGDAVFPIDPRLPRAARAALFAAVRPHVIVNELSDHPVQVDAQAPLLDDGDALVVTTSGSTGEPKAIVHSQASLLAHATAVHERLGVDRERDRWLACLPLNHLGGFGVIARSVLTDTPVDVLPRFDADAVQAAPADLGTTLVSVVTTALDRIDPSPFRWVVVGGSADPTVRPDNVVHTYGLTETGGGVIYDGIALPGVEVRIDADFRIAIRSATIARGRRHRDGSVEPLTDTDGWLATGDLGRWRPDGSMAIDGRADHLIITGGENVWPEPVEAVLRTHPGVADVLVTGESDAEWGQRVVAVVVPADPADPPTLEALRAHVKDQLPAHAAPRSLRLAVTLDRTSLGKLRRGDLPA